MGLDCANSRKQKRSAGKTGAEAKEQQKTEEVFHRSTPRLAPFEGNDH